MTTFQVPTLAQMTAEGKAPEVLFWVGCAGSFDDRAKKITKAMAKILHHTGIMEPSQVLRIRFVTSFNNPNATRMAHAKALALDARQAQAALPSPIIKWP